jgi:hypothetical protein
MPSMHEAAPLGSWRCLKWGHRPFGEGRHSNRLACGQRATTNVAASAAASRCGVRSANAHESPPLNLWLAISSQTAMCTFSPSSALGASWRSTQVRSAGRTHPARHQDEHLAGPETCRASRCARHRQDAPRRADTALIQPGPYPAGHRSPNSTRLAPRFRRTLSKQRAMPGRHPRWKPRLPAWTALISHRLLAEDLWRCADERSV